MRRDLDIHELTALLERPLVATLATYRPDGSALLSPVWHEWRDGGFNVALVGTDDVKARHLRGDPRAGLVVYESEPPYAGVEITTEARLTEQGYMEVERRLAVRYLGREAGERYAESVGSTGLVIRLEPGKLRTWDFADERWT